MERESIIKDKYLLIYFSIVYTVGITLHFIPSLFEFSSTASPYFLFINTGILLLYVLSKKDYKLFIWCLITIILTFVLEVIGVRTGMVFGDYVYGAGLGIKFFSVPLVIGLNWVMAILGIMELVRRFNIDDTTKVIIAGFIAVLFDFYLEQSALKLDYWSWKDNVVPIKNYIDWGLTTIIFGAIYFKLNIKTVIRPALYYFVLQFGFFAILYFATLLFKI